MGRPLIIGITTDYEPSESNRGARFFLKESYVTYFSTPDSTVLLLPFSGNVTPENFDFLDGVVLSGSGPDIPPSYYGEEQRVFPGKWMDPGRVDLELSILSWAEKADIPLFGICGGFQTINVSRGGSLIQDLPTETPGQVSHQESMHRAVFSDFLKELSGMGESMVNSFHHQGVKRMGTGLEVIGISPEDNLVEAFRDPKHPFLLGVQWHPERMAPEDSLSQILRDSFFDACRRYRDQKTGR
ncbi:MAG: gamma-glutamyl-gamma-aminobutyrate hydrolase family protein [Leptospirillia bacterium]